MAELKIVKGNDFYLKIKVTKKIVGGSSTEPLSLANVSDLKISLINIRETVLPTTLSTDELGVCYSLVSGLAVGTYDLQLTGKYNGNPIRSCELKTVTIVNNNASSNVTPNTYEGEDAYNVDIAVMLFTGSTGISDAPEDGKEYARKDGEWVEVDAIPGIVDNLSSNDSTKTLSAKQGKVLDGKVSDIASDVSLLKTGKQDTLNSGINIKTINGQSVLGSGNIVIEGGGGAEPEAYIKNAEVSGNTLTLTKKDNTTVEFTPEGGGSSVTVDSAMSGTSTNPVQNKVIKAYVDEGVTSASASAQASATSASNAETSASNAEAKLTAIQTAMESLPDGQAVSAQVALNMVDIAKIDLDVNGKVIPTLQNKTLTRTGATADLQGYFIVDEYIPVTAGSVIEWVFGIANSSCMLCEYKEDKSLHDYWPANSGSSRRITMGSATAYVKATFAIGGVNTGIKKTTGLYILDTANLKERGMKDDVADLKETQGVVNALEIKDRIAEGIKVNTLKRVKLTNEEFEESEYVVDFIVKRYSLSGNVLHIGDLSLISGTDFDTYEKQNYIWTLSVGSNSTEILIPSYNNYYRITVKYSSQEGKATVLYYGEEIGSVDIPEDSNSKGFVFAETDIYLWLVWININNSVLITADDINNQASINGYSILKRDGDDVNTFPYPLWNELYGISEVVNPANEFSFSFKTITSPWIPIAGFKKLYVNHLHTIEDAHSNGCVTFLFPNTNKSTPIPASAHNFEPFWIDVPKDANAVKLCISREGYVLGEADDEADFEERKRISQIVDDRIRPASGIKSVLYIGDSWTDGGSGGKPWVYTMNDIFGITTEVCVARAGRSCKSKASGTYTGHPNGTSIGCTYVAGSENMDMQNQVLLVDRLMNNPEEGESILFNANNHPDVVVIAMGTNDGVDSFSGYDTYEDFIEAQISTDISTSVGIVPKALADVDCTNFAGAIYFAIQKLYDLFPNTFIIFCLPPHTNLNCKSQRDKGEQIRKVCHRLGIAVCDWYSEIGFSSYTCPVTQKEDGTYYVRGNGDMGPDGLHPSANGYYKLGMGTAKAIMQKHPNYIG